MGAHLIFRLATGNAQAVNEWIEEQPEHKELTTTDGQIIHFWDQRDVEWAIEEIGEPMAEDTGKDAKTIGREYKDIGEGKIKTSSVADIEKCTELWTALFDKLHSKFEVEVYSGSCSLRRAYFSPKQIATITDDGDALTGDCETLSELFEQMDEIDTAAATEVSA